MKTQETQGCKPQILLGHWGVVVMWQTAASRILSSLAGEGPWLLFDEAFEGLPGGVVDSLDTLGRTMSMTEKTFFYCVLFPSNRIQQNNKVHCICHMFLRWGLTNSYTIKPLTKAETRETQAMDTLPPHVVSRTDKRCQWNQPSKPPKLAFRSVALRGMSPVKLRLYDLRSTASTHAEFMDREPVPPFASVHVLKSNLQKCLRRLESAKGLRTARRWLRCDPGSFLRRWPVILVEDALPTPAFVPLIWLMVAVTSHEYVLTARDEAFIMDTVREAFGHDTMLDIFKQHPIAYPDFRTLVSSPLFVQAMWVRVAYGGMDGDKAMLAGLVDHYKPVEGFMPPCLSLPPQPKSWDLQPADILDVSKDFHVFPRILDTLSGTLGKAPEEIKNTIWAHASGVTFRKSIDGSVLGRETRLAALQTKTLCLWTQIIKNDLYKQ